MNKEKWPVKIMHENRLAKIRDRKSYQFVKQQKPITFSLELKLTARFGLNICFTHNSSAGLFIISPYEIEMPNGAPQHCLGSSHNFLILEDSVNQ